MNHEKSCGAVVFIREQGEIQYLLVEAHDGVYGFPKGHVEGSETEHETALREIKEETGLEVTILDGFRESESYAIKGKVDTVKEVIYFVATFEGQKPTFQKEELSSVSFHPYEEALALLQMEGRKKTLQAADKYLRSIL